MLLALGFILGVHQGRIALWEEGQVSPKKIFPYRASSLPDADRQRLEQGIYVENTEELAKIAEDYLS